jgi:SAM-dependent methyltransferase
VEWTRLGSREAYVRRAPKMAGELRRRLAVEHALIGPGDRFVVLGYCWVCRRQVELAVDYSYSREVDGRREPNWREHLLCGGCHLNNRMRATVHFFESRISPARGARIYLAEQTTPLFRCISGRHAEVVGSEYLGSVVPFGEQDGRGIRNESVTRLTFPPASFDHVISLEVFEHVPEYRRALAECCRVLRPGGTMLFSVPFRPRYQENLVRATMDETGEIHHLLPPEYHGGFGWDLLDDLLSAGFADVAAYSFWSRDYAYLGSELIFFVARRRHA